MPNKGKAKGHTVKAVDALRYAPLQIDVKTQENDLG